MPNFIKIGQAVLGYNTRTGSVVISTCLPSVHIVQRTVTLTAKGLAFPFIRQTTANITHNLQYRVIIT